MEAVAAHGWKEVGSWSGWWETVLVRGVVDLPIDLVADDIERARPRCPVDMTATSVLSYSLPVISKARSGANKAVRIA